MEFHFTKHASEKFEILKRHSIKVSKALVIEILENPDLIDYSRLPLKIAQGEFDKNRVLRIVYKEQEEVKIIITFYPGRKEQYEKK